MKTLTAIAKNNNIKYSQLRDKLDELRIIYKYKKRYMPTGRAIEEGIAVEHSRFGNEHVLSINYQYDEELVMDCYKNGSRIINDIELPF